MLRSLAKSLRKPLLWLMVPLAVLAGRPTSGCICVDGTVKTTCCKSGLLLSSLCDSRVDSKDCCQGNSATCPYCGHSQDGRPPGGTSCSATSGCQCQALANSAESVKNTKWSAETGDSSSRVPADARCLLPPVVAFQVASVPADVLPPPDRVVLFLHLTI